MNKQPEALLLWPVLTTMSIMAKRKKKEQNVDAVGDQHAAKKMFRVEDDIHAGYKALAEKNDRPMSREVRAALIKHLKDNGLWPPPNH